MKPSGKYKGIYITENYCLMTYRVLDKRTDHGKNGADIYVDSGIAASVRNDIFVYFWIEAFFQERKAIISAKHHHGNGMSFLRNHLSSLPDTHKQNCD